MWNTPSKKELAKIPKLYETENIPLEDKIIYMHFFAGGSDWFIAEYDGEDIFFGFAVLNGDYVNAEWGYVSFSELKEINIKGIQIDRDLFWEVRSDKKFVWPDLYCPICHEKLPIPFENGAQG